METYQEEEVYLIPLSALRDYHPSEGILQKPAQKTACPLLK